MNYQPQEGSHLECELVEVRGTLARLAALLTEAAPLWTPRSFEWRELPWQAQFPHLAELLWRLDDDTLEALDADQEKLLESLWPSLIQDLEFQNLESQGIAVTSSPVWDKALFGWHLTPYPETKGELLPRQQEVHLAAGIKGRKWQQISRFASLVAMEPCELPLLEWCAGKGHLGRLLTAATGREVLSLEWQAQLCVAGEEEAKRRGLKQHFVCADAFAASEDVLQSHQHGVALHACGELHLNLMRRAARAGTQRLSISPCCYHLIPSGDLEPISQSAKALNFRLDRHGLQLPLNHSVIANAKARADRMQEVSWRLGFDSLQRQLRGMDEYLPLPSVRQSQLSGSFEAFCRWGAEVKGLTLSDELPLEPFRLEGQQRRRLTARIDVAAHLFRPVIEHFLLLDRVAFLLESGYRVSLGAFCEQQVTPRNALIQAVRRG
ncbi:methyltransferase [Shewanella cyperi]|uniref:methyltransferase n=1 Tax=Shewanella cyperi TaxID=2814292 RepID=UPI001A948C3C|nr:methyltransferase [Shewanella cyperi]QSX41974.1 methyltransferase [Shewanella cyperi]